MFLITFKINDIINCNNNNNNKNLQQITDISHYCSLFLLLLLGLFFFFFSSYTRGQELFNGKIQRTNLTTRLK